MNRSTLAFAYAEKTGRTVRIAAEPPPPAPGPAVRPPASAPRSTPREIDQEALLVAVRRSLASCRNSAERRMLAAFEAAR
jgi:hypothetical protein